MKLIKGLIKDTPVNLVPEGYWIDAKNKVWSNGVIKDENGIQSVVNLGYIPIGELVLPDDSLLVFSIHPSTSANLIWRVVNGVANQVCNFNFGMSLTHPIKARGRVTAEGDFEVVFTDARPYSEGCGPRSITINSQTNNIRQDSLEDTKLFPRVIVPNFQLVTVSTGGSLAQGTYLVSIAYKFDDNSGYTNWVGCSRPIVVKANNSSITLTVVDIDTKFSGFKVGMIITTDVGATIAKETIFDFTVDTTDASSIVSKTIVLSNQGLRDIDVAQITVKRPSYDSIGDLAVVGNRLYASELKREGTVEFQEYANQITIGAIYDTEIALDSIRKSYADPVVIFNTTGFMDDEVYAFFIRLIGYDGVPLGDWFIPAETVGANMGYHQNTERYPKGKGYPVDGQGNEKYIRFHKFFKKSKGDFVRNVSTFTSPTAGPLLDKLNTASLSANSVPNFPGTFYVEWTSKSGTYGTLYSSRAWRPTTTQEVTISFNAYIQATRVAEKRFRLLLYKRPQNDEDALTLVHSVIIHSNDQLDTAIGSTFTRLVSFIKKVKVNSDEELVFCYDQGAGMNAAIASGPVSIGVDIDTQESATVFTRPTGIAISNIVIPDSIKEVCQGFEILYAKRNTSNASVVEEGVLFPKYPYEEGVRIYSMGVEKRFHAFGLLADKPNLGISHIRSSFVFQVFTEGFSETAVGAQIFDTQPSAPAPLPVEYFDHEVLRQRYIQFNNSAQDNKGGETHIQLLTRDVVKTTQYSNYVFTAIAFNRKDNYYQPFDSQILIQTGYVWKWKNLTPTGTSGGHDVYTIPSQYGGDTFTCLYETRVSTWSEVVGGILPEFLLNYTTVKVPVRSQYNIALREFNESIWYEANVMTYPAPEEAVVAAFPDNFESNASKYNTLKLQDTYYKLSPAFRVLPDLVQASIQGELIEEFPYRVIRSPKQTQESLISSWKIFLPEDYYEQNRDRGKIVNIATWDTDKLIIHHERGLFYTKGSNQLMEGANEVVIGIRDIFEGSPQEPIYSEEGYLGTSKKWFNKTTPQGYLFESEGRIFLLGERLEELTKKGMRGYFRALISGVGDNPYLQDKGNQNYVGGMSAAWDDKEERLLIAINKASGSETWSYCKDLQAWISSHDTIDCKLFNSSNSWFTFKSYTLWKGEESLYRKYFGEDKESHITFSFAEPISISKLAEALYWISTVREGAAVKEDETFTHIEVKDSLQEIPKTVLIPFENIRTAHNIRRAFKGWHYNNLRVSGATLKDRRRFVDDHLIVTLYYSADSNKRIDLSEIITIFSVEQL